MNCCLVAQLNCTSTWESSVILRCAGLMWQIGSRSSSVYDSVQVSPQPSARLHVWGVQCACQSSKSPNDSNFVGQLLHTCYATDAAQHLWLLFICRGWSDGLELTVQRSVQPRPQFFHLRLPVDDSFFWAVLDALSTLEALCDNALYKLTLTLHWHWHVHYY